MIKLSKIKPNKANPRLIKDWKYTKLLKSLQEFPKMMELRPIIVDIDNTILGGNMRYKALLDLEYKEVPDNWIKKASGLTDDEKQRFIIEDNVNFGEFDTDLLSSLWDAELLQDWGVDIPDIEDQDNPNTEPKGKKETICPECGHKF
jgi:hypothetical protein